MCLHSEAILSVPDETVRVAKAAFPKGNLYMRLRDELGVFYQDEDGSITVSTTGSASTSTLAIGDDTGDAICQRTYLIDKQRKQCKGELTGNTLCP